MLIARELRKTNIAEYILYMWQIEDSLRVCVFKEELIEKYLVGRFKANRELSKEILAWYSNLALMMENEHVRENGHLQVFINLVNDMNEFHLKMIEVKTDPVYVNLYAEARPIINDLIHNSNTNNEIEVCLRTLYGLMTLKLQQSEVSAEAQQTTEQLAGLVGHLSARYIQFENDDFEF